MLVQGAGDQPVLRFHGVVLTSGAVGFEPGPFDGEGEHLQAGGVPGLGVPQRLDGGIQRGRSEHREHLGQHALLQPPPAKALAAFLAPVELLGTGTHVAGAVALGAGVAGLHHPSAPSAPDSSLQQRGSLPGGTATTAAGRAPVLAQLGGVGL